jgi:hypothetical protein
MHYRSRIFSGGDRPEAEERQGSSVSINNFLLNEKFDIYVDFGEGDCYN